MTAVEVEKKHYEDYAFGFLDRAHCVTAAGRTFRYAGTHYHPLDKPKADLRRWMLGQKAWDCCAASFCI